MTTFTEATLLAFISAHNCVPPKAAQIMQAYAAVESGYDTTKVHSNPNGTEDVGIGQINTANFGWLSKALGQPITKQVLLTDPCLNLAAGLRVLLVKYNGNPPDPTKITYTNSLLSKIADTGHPAPTTATEVPTGGGPPVVECTAPPWDTWGQQACRAHKDDNKPTDEKKGTGP